MLSPYKQATLIGFTAIFFWSTAVGFARLASDGFGPYLAPAINFTTATLCLLLFNTKKAIQRCKQKNINFRIYAQVSSFFKNIPFFYVLICGSLFVLYNFTFVLAIGISTTQRQVLEVGLINYLWPSLIILFSVLFFKEKVKKSIYVGVILAFLGIIISTSKGNVNLTIFWNNLQASPLPYALVFFSAFAWALYSNLLHYWQNHNCLFLFFAFLSFLFWFCAFKLGDFDTFSFSHFPYLAFISSIVLGIINAVSYFTWEIAITKGNMTLLAVASYFIPILSTLFTALCFLKMPDINFFYGVFLVIIGSLISWYATRK